MERLKSPLVTEQKKFLLCDGEITRSRTFVCLDFSIPEIKKQNEGDTMQDFELLERLTKTEERTKSNTHRLDKLEPIVNEIHTMSNTMVQLVEEVKHTNETVSSLDEKVERMDNRVDIMERSPADDMRAYRKTAVTAMISTIAGALAAGVLVWAASYL